MSDENTTLLEQTGGWFNASIASVLELTVCPDILTNANANTVVFADSDDDLEILPVRENINITASPKKTKSGVLYDIKGSFEMNYQSSLLDTYFNKYILEDVVLIGIKHDGQQNMFGSKNHPLKFSYQLINGVKYEDGSRIRVNISGKIPQKPVFIGG